MKNSKENISQLNGPLFRSYHANGVQSLDEPDKVDTPAATTYNPFWGQIAVRDLDQWYGVHYFMRMELAFTAGNPNTDATENDNIFYPIYWWGETLANYVDTPYNPAAQPNAAADKLVEVCPHKFSIVSTHTGSGDITNFNISTGGTGYTAKDVLRVKYDSTETQGTFALIQVVSVDVNGVITNATLIEGGENYEAAHNPRAVIGGTGSGAQFNITAVASGQTEYYLRYYSTLPVNHIVPTNIAYNENNIKMIAKVFSRTEKYNGDFETERDNHVWFQRRMMLVSFTSLVV